MDYDMTLYTAIRNNDIVMENLNEMMIDQEGRNRIGYIDTAVEAFSNPAKQANLLNKLFKDVQKVEEIDFGKIPDSKGDITKYVYYTQMYQCIEVLNNIVEGHLTPNITTMNKLHEILLSARGDFTFGYRTDNFLIMNVYNLMVTNLYELINVCTIDATEYLRAKLSMDVKTPVERQIKWVTKTANQFIKMYESGQWSTIMKSIRSGNDVLPATEAISGSINFDLNNVETTANQINNSINKLNEVKGSISKDSIKSGIKNIFTSHKIIATVAIVIGLLLIVRSVIKYFMNAAGKLSDRIKNNAEILKAAAAAEKEPTALRKQQKMLEGLEKITDKIDYNILKSERAASTDMKKDNKENYNPEEITAINGSDFEL